MGLESLQEYLKHSLNLGFLARLKNPISYNSQLKGPKWLEERIVYKNSLQNTRAKGYITKWQQMLFALALIGL
jgi:hypothetical protein